MEKLMVFIVFNRAIDDEIRELMENSGIKYYTRWKDVTGVGTKGPNFGDHVWPGMNNVVMTVIEEDKKENLIKGINSLRDRFPVVGLKAFVVPVLEII